jgi:hypothetical protein
MCEGKDSQDMKYESILLKHQLALLTILSPTINVEWLDERTLVASNISETEMINLTMITNDPSHNARIHVDSINVSLNDEKKPTRIYGLYDICLEKIETEDVLSYAENLRTFQPFKNGFRNGITINELCDKLSALALRSPDTFRKVKKYSIVLGNCAGYPTKPCKLW